MKSFLIYCLIDPISNEIRYVGKSQSGLKRAREIHGFHCGNWMNSLKKNGLKPTVKIVQEFHNNVSRNDLQAAEIYWVKYFKDLGCHLTNLTSGGDGTFGYIHKAETIRKIVSSNGGRPIVDQNGQVYVSVHDASRKLNLYACHIFRILKGLRKKTGGFSFKYAEER